VKTTNNFEIILTKDNIYPKKDIQRMKERFK
jgi:hypothetical protein